MTEPFEFNGFLFVLTGNWIWILMSFLIGVWFGWATAKPDQASDEA